MADGPTEESKLAIETVKPLIKDALAMAQLEEAEFSARKARPLVAQLKKMTAELTSFRPSGKQTGVENYSKAIYPYVLKADQAATVLQELIDHALDNSAVGAPRNDRMQQAPLPRSLELSIPVFNGEFDKYPSFKEGFAIVTRNVTMTPEHRFMLYRDHLGPKVRPQFDNLAANNENFPIMVAAMDEKYGKKERIVSSLYDRLDAIPIANTATASLRKTLDAVEEVLRALEIQKGNIDTNEYVYNKVYSKFPTATKFTIFPDVDPDLPSFRARMERYVNMQETFLGRATEVEVPNPIPEINLVAIAAKEDKNQRKPRENTRKMDHNKERPPRKPKVRKCIFCEQNHLSADCTQYKTAKERKAALGEGCTICATKKHKTADCNPSYPKVCYHCHAVNSHHAAFCSNPPAASKTLEPPKTKLVGLVKSRRNTHLTARHWVANPETGEDALLRIFLDIGAGNSFVTDRVAEMLKLLPYDEEWQSIAGFGDEEGRQVWTSRVEIAILGRKLKVETTKLISKFLPHFDYAEFQKMNPEFRNTKFADAGEGEVDVLIGSDYYFHFVGAHQEIARDIFMIETSFGKMIAGRASARFQGVIANMVTANNHTDSLKSYWDLETLGIKEKEANDKFGEDDAYTQFTAHLEYHGDRYVSKLPWKANHLPLPTNEKLAKARMYALLKQYAKDPAFIPACNSIISAQLEEGIIERAEKTESPDVHYLPWHVVRTPEKSTPLRIVYNASAQASKRDPSLNECLLKGLNLTPKVPEILIRFRLRRVAVAGDVRHAFHNVGIHESDRDFLRFFWTKIPSMTGKTELVPYRFTRVPFGCVSSGFLLAATIRYHANKSENPLAERIKKDLYIDDYITSVESETEAEQLIENIVQIFREAGMHIHKWLTNAADVNIPIELKESKTETKVLGIQWNVTEDTLTVADPGVKYEFPESISKRQVLQGVAKLYDPLAWLVPVTVKSKIFMQTLHEMKLGWNDVLSMEQRSDWNELVEDMKQLKAIQFKRYLKGFNEKTLSLHVFCDASAKAYAMVIYARYLDASTNQIRTGILMAKARVTPISKVTIPRLELLAVLIGVRLLNFVKNTLMLTNPVKAIIWTDSTVTLDWINSKHKLPTFIQNRVDEITKVADTEFRHVKGKENPADLPSRGISATALIDADIWWYGPSWLQFDSEAWPPVYIPSAAKFESEAAPILPAITIKAVRSPFGINEVEFSTWERLLKNTSRLIYCFRKKFKKLWTDQSEACTDIARRIWIQCIQARFFANEITELKEQKRKKSELSHQLGLFLDDKGYIRTNGRILNADQLPYEVKFPILLPDPNKCYVSFLLIDVTHRRAGHPGAPHTLQTLRRRYWVVAGRQKVESVVRKCIICKEARARPYPQPTFSNLPSSRFAIDQFPFTHIGIDVAGPFHMLIPKRWVLVVTCLTVRAIALEVLEDMRTVTLSLAYRRITARYTQPDSFVSDNAPQFVLLAQHLHRTRVESFQWKYVTEYSPWEGGCYERLVKAVKETVEKLNKVQRCESDAEFRTLIAETEMVLNDRPLTYVGAEPNTKILTPNDFLRVKINENLSEAKPLPPDASKQAQNLIAIWKRHEEALTYVKRIWKAEYLLYLKERAANQRFKKQTNLRIPQVGDLVLVEEKNYKRSQWPVAVVDQVQISTDGQIRSCVVRLPSRIKLVRPVEHLYYLELNENIPPEPPQNAQPQQAASTSKDSDEEYG